MRLFEHSDFDQVILAAEDHFRSRNLRAAIIEKDYFVTEALRAVAAAGGSFLIFKGGTSLSKGWNLIDRFSEDLDLFLDPQSVSPPLGKKGIDKALKRLRDAVAKHPALTLVAAEGQTIGGFGRTDHFAFGQRFGGPGEVANRVLLESGTASGREPTEHRPLRSYVAEYLSDIGTSLGADDEQAFTMRLLHFRRTFVEKLFAIHGKVEILKRDGRPLGSYARHYYDLYRLAATPEVLAMLKTDEYGSIKSDYDRISRDYFARDYHHPTNMRFSSSDALFPASSLSNSLGQEYERQCRILCYGPFPSWFQVRSRFEDLRSDL